MLYMSLLIVYTCGIYRLRHIKLPYMPKGKVMNRASRDGLISNRS